MSKQDKIAKLKEYIKNYVIKELEKDEDIEEASTTASAGAYHYDTPYAFYGGRKKDKEKKKKISHAGGYKPVNEKLSVDPRKVYGGTGAKQGMVLTAQKGLKKILDLSKKNPSNVFLVSDDNYTNFGPYYVKNGKVAKYTVANPNYDLQKNKVSRLKVPSDVILKFTINESYSSIFIEISKAIKVNRPDELNAIRDLADEYDIGRVLYMARTNPKALRKAVDYRAKERKQFIKGKNLKELKEVTKQEVNALRNLVKGIGNLKKDFSKATKVGDRELMKKDYNKHYETILDAEKAMVELMQFFKTKEMLGEGRYHDWRNDESLTPKQKIGQSMREIRDALNELDKTVKMNLKLKTELNMSSQDYWKNTHKALTKISERLVKMANKIGNLK